MTIDEAKKKFKAADQAAGTLTSRLADASDKLLAAHVEVANAQRQIEGFAHNLDIQTEDAEQLITRQAKAKNVASLLEQAVDHLTLELARAKVDVVTAEIECAGLQAQSSLQTLTSLCDDFVRSNRPTLLKLTQLMRLQSTLESSARHGGAAQDVDICCHVEQLWMGSLTESLARIYGDDEGFRNACVHLPKGQQSEIDHSQHVTNAERSRIWNERTRGRDEQVRALMPVFPQPEPAFDHHAAFNAARNAAQQAEECRYWIGHYKERFETHPGDEGLKKAIDHYTERVAHFDSIVARWDAEIEAHRAD